MALPSIPTSWTDLGMNWTDVHVAPYDPYFIAVAEAIKERAIAVDEEANINTILLTPNALYDINGGAIYGYSKAIQDAITLLIPKFNNPSLKEPWTEAAILSAIGAVSRIEAKEFMTADWLLQQYDILNKLLEYNYVYAITKRNSAKVIRYKFGQSYVSMSDAVSQYNGASWITGSFGLSTWILRGRLSAGQYTVVSQRVEYLARVATESEIPIGSTVDVYIKYNSGGGTYFTSLDGKLENVFYLEAEGIYWNPSELILGILWQNIGVIVDGPEAVTVEQFPNENDGFGYDLDDADMKLHYQKPSEDFNFKL